MPFPGHHLIITVLFFRYGIPLGIPHDPKTFPSLFIRENQIWTNLFSPIHQTLPHKSLHCNCDVFQWKNGQKISFSAWMGGKGCDYVRLPSRLVQSAYTCKYARRRRRALISHSDPVPRLLFSPLFSLLSTSLETWRKEIKEEEEEEWERKRGCRHYADRPAAIVQGPIAGWLGCGYTESMVLGSYVSIAWFPKKRGIFRES